jgi:hypothetical protein
MSSRAESTAPSPGPAPSRTEEKWPALLLLALCVVSTVGILTTSAFVSHQAMHPLPLHDHWHTVLEYQRLLDGEYGLRELWGLHNEHRISFPRLLFFADYHWFLGKSTFLILAIYLIQLAHALLFCRLAWRWSNRTPVASAILISLVLTVMMSAAQRQTLNWSFEVQVPLTFLAATGAFCCLALLAHSEGESRRSMRAWAWLCGCCVAATVATYSMANGLFSWPVLIAAALRWRIPFRYLAVLILVSTAVGTSFLIGHPLFSRPDQPSLELGEVLSFTSIYLGNPLFPFGQVVSGVIGMIVLGSILCAGAVFILRPSKNPLVGTCIQVLSFVLLTAVATGISRHGMPGGLDYAFQSRYCTSTLLAWAVLILLVFHFGRFVLPGQPSLKATLTTCAIVVLQLALWRIQLIEAKHAPGRLAYLETLTERFMAGERSEELYRSIYPNHPQIVGQSVEFLRANELGIYAPR